MECGPGCSGTGKPGEIKSRFRISPGPIWAGRQGPAVPPRASRWVALGPHLAKGRAPADADGPEGPRVSLQLLLLLGPRGARMWRDHLRDLQVLAPVVGSQITSSDPTTVPLRQDAEGPPPSLQLASAGSLDALRAGSAGLLRNHTGRSTDRMGCIAARATWCRRTWDGGCPSTCISVVA